MRLDFRNIEKPKDEKPFELSATDFTEVENLDINEINWKYDSDEQEHWLLNSDVIQSEKGIANTIINYRMDALFDFFTGVINLNFIKNYYYPEVVRKWMKSKYKTKREFKLKLSQLFDDLQLSYFEYLQRLNAEQENYKEKIIQAIFTTYKRFEVSFFYATTREFNILTDRLWVWTEINKPLYKFRWLLSKELKECGLISSSEISVRVGTNPLVRTFEKNADILLEENSTAYQIEDAIYSLGEIITHPRLSLDFLTNIPHKLNLLHSKEHLNSYNEQFSLLSLITTKYLKYSDTPYFSNVREFAKLAIDISYEGQSLFYLAETNQLDLFDARSMLFEFIVGTKNNFTKPPFILNKIKSAYFRNEFIHSFYTSPAINKWSGGKFKLANITSDSAFTTRKVQDYPITLDAVKKRSRNQSVSIVENEFINSFFDSFN